MNGYTLLIKEPTTQRLIAAVGPIPTVDAANRRADDLHNDPALPDVLTEVLPLGGIEHAKAEMLMGQ